MKNFLILSASALLLVGCGDGSSNLRTPVYEYSGAYGNGLTSAQIAEADARFSRGAKRRAAGETFESMLADQGQSGRTTSSPVANTSYCSTGWFRGSDGICHFAGSAPAPSNAGTIQRATLDEYSAPRFEVPCNRELHVYEDPVTRRLTEFTTNPNNCPDKSPTPSVGPSTAVSR